MKKNNLSLLIADDHDIFRQGLAALLADNSRLSVVAQAKNGKDALLQIKKYKPDVAILDVTMPGMNGVEVCEQVLEKELPTQIIILTMHDDVLLVQEALAAGAKGFLIKDNTFEEVMLAIETVSSNGVYLSRAIKRSLRQEKNNLTPLSNREQEVLCLIAGGHTIRDIAQNLGVSTKSVDTYRARLLKKIGANNSAQLIQYAVKRSLV